MSRRGLHRSPRLQLRYSKLVEAWPPPDQARWAKATEAGDPFDPGGWASHWAPPTRHKAETDYGCWLAWLDRNAELDPALDPEIRVTRARVGRYLKYMRASLGSFTVQSRLQGLGDMLRVMTETQEFRWVGRGAARLRTGAVSVKNKRQKLKSTDELVDLGVSLMAQADILHKTDAHSAALLYRNGLIVAFLAYRPVRVANLAAIALGKHLAQRSDGWWLVFAAEETKQRRVLEFPFPVRLEAALDRYLELYRPLLLAHGPHSGSAGDALWISHDGGASTSGGLGQAIQRVTKEKFGRPINPHLFRDCAATTMAINDSAHADAIALILSHASMDTSERHYNQAGSLEAGREYHAVLLVNRRTARADIGKGI